MDRQPDLSSGVRGVESRCCTQECGCQLVDRESTPTAAMPAPPSKRTPAERRTIIENAQQAVLADCRRQKEEAESWGPRGPPQDDPEEPVSAFDGPLLGATRDVGAVRKIIARSKAATTEAERAQNARDLMELYGPLPTAPEPETSDSEEEVVLPPTVPAGIRMREAANEVFRKGAYREAIAAYAAAARELDGAEAAKCHANASEAHLRLGDHARAAEAASAALALDDSNVAAGVLPWIDGVAAGVRLGLD